MIPFFYSIALLSLFITLVLSIFFSLTKNGKKTGNRIMAALLVLFSTQIFYSFAVSNYAFGFFMDWHKTLYVLRQTSLLSGPLIYLYFQVVLSNTKIKLNHLLHAIPFATGLIFLGFYYSTINNFVIWKSPINLYDSVFIFTQNLLYIILTINKFKNIFYSNPETFKKLKSSSHNVWLQFFLLGFIVLWALNLNIFATYMIFKRPDWCAFTGSIYALVFFLFLCSIMFLLLLKPEIYYLIEKYKNSPVPDDVKNKYKQSLIEYMDIKKPYLEPEVSLEDVAKDMSINTRLLSQIINQSFSKNFNGYMNEFRINEALHQLSDIRNTKTIQEILYNSGFNSTSVFYTEFKKHTGLTPQEYRTTRSN